MQTVIYNFLTQALWFDQSVTLELVAAQFGWFFGGMAFAAAFAAFGTIMRAARGAASDVVL